MVFFSRFKQKSLVFSVDFCGIFSYYIDFFGKNLADWLAAFKRRDVVCGHVGKEIRIIDFGFLFVELKSDFIVDIVLFEKLGENANTSLSSADNGNDRFSNLSCH